MACGDAASILVVIVELITFTMEAVKISKTFKKYSKHDETFQKYSSILIGMCKWTVYIGIFKMTTVNWGIKV